MLSRRSLGFRSYFWLRPGIASPLYEESRNYFSVGCGHICMVTGAYGVEGCTCLCLLGCFRYHRACRPDLFIQYASERYFVIDRLYYIIYTSTDDELYKCLIQVHERCRRYNEAFSPKKVELCLLRVEHTLVIWSTDSARHLMEEN